MGMKQLDLAGWFGMLSARQNPVQRKSRDKAWDRKIGQQ